MILRADSLKDVCSKILSAVEGSELSMVTDTLELVSFPDGLHLRVTNKEYFVDVKLPVEDIGEFHAAVNANLFLKLISQITTESIEMEVKDTYLQVKGNGVYKLPLIFDNNVLLELPAIVINNPTCELNIESDSLLSILQYNSKQLSIGTITKPVQKLYYLDENGAITFTTGGCVNTFALEKPIKLLLNNRLVKLFKLFKTGSVKLTLGYDAISDDIIQTKVKFESNDITLTAILSCDDSMLRSFPVAAVRGRATAMYPYSINVNKDALLQTINRLLLFSSGFGSKDIVKPYATFEFKSDRLTIWDVRKENSEDVNYISSSASLSEMYEAVFDLTDLKTTLESCTEQYLTMNFGDGQAMVIKRGNIANIIPQCKVM